LRDAHLQPGLESNQSSGVASEQIRGPKVPGSAFRTLMADVALDEKRIHPGDPGCRDYPAAQTMRRVVAGVDAGGGDASLHDVLDSLGAERICGPLAVSRRVKSGPGSGPRILIHSSGARTAHVTGFPPRGTPTLRPATPSRFCFSRLTRMRRPSSQNARSSRQRGQIGSPQSGSECKQKQRAVADRHGCSESQHMGCNYAELGDGHRPAFAAAVPPACAGRPATSCEPSLRPATGSPPGDGKTQCPPHIYRR